jgi:hypothetical protein
VNAFELSLLCVCVFTLKHQDFISQAFRLGVLHREMPVSLPACKIRRDVIQSESLQVPSSPYLNPVRSVQRRPSRGEVCRLWPKERMRTAAKWKRQSTQGNEVKQLHHHPCAFILLILAHSCKNPSLNNARHLFLLSSFRLCPLLT